MSPFELLGVVETAGDDEIRAAYHKAVLAHPPDRDPEGFQKVRAAFDAIRDEEARLELRLFGPPPFQSLLELLDELGEGKRWVGPGPWIATLKETGP